MSSSDAGPAAAPGELADGLFSRFELWEGVVDPGWSVNFLGVRTRIAYFAPDAGPRVRQRVQTDRPPVDEEFMEWLDLLEAVTQARDRFTMVELGAGWGRWLVNGAAAAQALGLDYYLVGVEAEPTHYRWLKQHAKDNGIQVDSTKFIEAAVADRPGWVRFHVGDPRDWYGQAAANSPAEEPHPGIRDRLSRAVSRLRPRARNVIPVRAVSLAQVVDDLDIVDLVDADIQGAEADVFEAGAEILDATVRRVHIGTHSSTNEERLREIFRALRWKNVHDYSCLSEANTPWGRIKFEDGVQSWINPRL